MIYYKTVEKLDFLLQHLFHQIIIVSGLICWLLQTSLPSLMTVGPCVLQLLTSGGKTLTWPYHECVMIYYKTVEKLDFLPKHLFHQIIL